MAVFGSLFKVQIWSICWVRLLQDLMQIEKLMLLKSDHLAIHDMPGV